MHNWKHFLIFIVLVIGLYHFLSCATDTFLMEYILDNRLNIPFIQGCIHSISLYVPYLLVKRFTGSADKAEERGNSNTKASGLNSGFLIQGKSSIWYFIGGLSCCFLLLGIRYGNDSALQQTLSAEVLMAVAAFSLFCLISENVVRRLSGKRSAAD